MRMKENVIIKEIKQQFSFHVYTILDKCMQCGTLPENIIDINLVSFYSTKVFFIMVYISSLLTFKKVILLMIICKQYMWMQIDQFNTKELQKIIMLKSLALKIYIVKICYMYSEKRHIIVFQLNIFILFPNKIEIMIRKI